MQREYQTFTGVGCHPTLVKSSLSCGVAGRGFFDVCNVFYLEELRCSWWLVRLAARPFPACFGCQSLTPLTDRPRQTLGQRRRTSLPDQLLKLSPNLSDCLPRAGLGLSGRGSDSAAIASNNWVANKEPSASR